jgi:hypothetical protein
MEMDKDFVPASSSAKVSASSGAKNSGFGKRFQSNKIATSGQQLQKPSSSFSGCYFWVSRILKYMLLLVEKLGFRPSSLFHPLNHFCILVHQKHTTIASGIFIHVCPYSYPLHPGEYPSVKRCNI